MMRRLLLVLLPLLAACSGAAADAPKPALELTGRVVDKAGLLDSATATALTARLARLERQTGVQMVIATTPTLGGEAINDYSLRLARSWALGSKERNDGLLLLVAPTERKVRIEVGKGLETVMKDEVCDQIIRHMMMPHFTAGDPQSAILAGTGAMIDVLEHRPARKVAA